MVFIDFLFRLASIIQKLFMKCAVFSHAFGGQIYLRMRMANIISCAHNTAANNSASVTDNDTTTAGISSVLGKIGNSSRNSHHF